MSCKIADELGLQRGYVLACIAAERSRKPEVKQAWAGLVQRMAAVAVLLLVAFVTLTIVPNKTNGNALQAAAIAASAVVLMPLPKFNIIYIMRSNG